MKLLTQLVAWAAALGSVVAVKCSVKHDEPTPEQLIEQQPSGAGQTEEVEQRPGYFKPGIKPIHHPKEKP